MKLKQKIGLLAVEYAILPRDGGDVIFAARGVLNPDFDEFLKLCPEPTPPIKRFPDGNTVQDVTDPEYKKAITDFLTKRFQFMIIKSLSATEGLDWEKVQLADHTTWGKYEEELKAITTPSEYSQVIQAVHRANGLDDKRIEEAKKRFFSRQSEPTQ